MKKNIRGEQCALLGGGGDDIVVRCLGSGLQNVIEEQRIFLSGILAWLFIDSRCLERFVIPSLRMSRWACLAEQTCDTRSFPSLPYTMDVSFGC